MFKTTLWHKTNAGAPLSFVFVSAHEKRKFFFAVKWKVFPTPPFGCLRLELTLLKQAEKRREIQLSWERSDLKWKWMWKMCSWWEKASGIGKGARRCWVAGGKDFLSKKFTFFLRLRQSSLVRNALVLVNDVRLCTALPNAVLHNTKWFSSTLVRSLSTLSKEK